jgi:peptidoglycan hydrolase CwlO-like protein
MQAKLTRLRNDLRRLKPLRRDASLRLVRHQRQDVDREIAHKRAQITALEEKIAQLNTRVGG